MVGRCILCDSHRPRNHCYVVHGYKYLRLITRGAAQIIAHSFGFPYILMHTSRLATFQLMTNSQIHGMHIDISCKLWSTEVVGSFRTVSYGNYPSWQRFRQVRREAKVHIHLEEGYGRICRNHSIVRFLHPLSSTGVCVVSKIHVVIIFHDMVMCCN